MNQDTPTASSAHSGATMDQRIARPGRGRRKLLVRGAIALAVLIVLVVAYLLMPGANAVTVDRDSVRIGTVESEPFRDYVPLRGEVTPLRTVYVSALAGGQVDALVASDGAMVVSGEPLVRLVNPDLQCDVATRTAGIAGQLSNVSGERLSVQRSRQQAESELADARNQLRRAEHDLHVKQTLFEKNIVNEAAVRPLREDVAYLRERVEALEVARRAELATLADQEARIDQSQRQLRASLEMVEQSLDALTIRAPAGGRLTAFTVQPGQAIQPGDRIGQIDSEGAWKLVADVDQFYLNRVRIGQHAAAEIGGRKVSLTVSKILPQVENGRFRIELVFAERAPDGLNRGQIVDGKLVLGAAQRAVVAPSGPWLDAGGTIAFVVDADGNRAVRRSIAVGRRNPEQVEITSGLTPGERIVLGSIDDYATRDQLRIR
ncbi:efflux RND transporter periplasmic adaptor subunit [Stakelama tenebrarum]|nr:HlyD family efflux transporter periplasmic adaptor subunit [Sphingosinithalassobacter tenebrarum]